MTVLTFLASLFGYGRPEPQILDGPGMEYVDSEYRNDYANCFPFDELHGDPYFAVAYLGRGETGRENKEVYINRFFETLTAEQRSSIPCYESDGDEWYLVVPRYKDSVDLIRGDVQLNPVPIYETAFVVKCNGDVTVEAFNVTDKKYTLAVDGNGVLKDISDIVWDITNF